MIKVKKHGVVLSPTTRFFEDRSVLNPGILQEGRSVHMVYRAINKDYMSSLGYARFNGATHLDDRLDKPFMEATAQYESHGMEDPRITQIDNEIYLIYVAHDGRNAQIAYAYGHDLFHLKRGGLIGPKIRYSAAAKLFNKKELKDDYLFFEAFYKNYAGTDVLIWEKDGVLFPEKIRGKFVLTHRILPDIQIVSCKDFSELKSTAFWKDYIKNLHKFVVLENKYRFEERHIGGGAPPIKTKHGWLMLYHGVEESNAGRIYHAAAALFDLKNPKKLISRLPYPLFSPEKDFELKGHVDSVVFPTGTAQFGDKLYIYYGAADSHIAVASVNLDDLLDELLRYKTNQR
ncbi:pesticidal protein Cry7Aa [Candidatus Falkowbacteria bacterium CG10_big_fil_rev_8_21_14_0_10_37_14]|uniref:Pesticidal protein Cry7Aa n=1 Tax=Candidatus Falkowbacteria bacterium CG10_big_fil_rev_8_21_14_0_10_37_14 TaxID=1974561 RepID=A0A2M6WUD3_9BACT|nr:pesticidal protein Cry7Aa [Candidatus Falkowbacteria bacterium]PIT96390.1 MAG: pesticidal protein Cry7Aa [Candidatus Falkowbacteria bacterium CG10_big_fil_rev_8_21_14_0_10_37_14]